MSKSEKPAPATPGALFKLASGGPAAPAVCAAAALDLPVAMAGKQSTVAELAAATNSFAPYLARLLRALRAAGLVGRTGKGRW